MRRPSARRASVLAAVMLLIPAGRAWSDVPDPSQCDIPSGIHLVGTLLGVPDPFGTFTVVVRGASTLPIRNVRVEIDFSQCAPDIKLCATQPGLEGMDCGDKRVWGTTDGAGRVSFTIVGSSNNMTGAAPGHALNCVRIYMEGIGISHARVAAFDQNGVGGVNPVDMSVWLPDSFSGTFFERSDYNFDGNLTPGDLSLLLQVSLSTFSFTSCGSYCQ
jgi:hypothetical protein